VSGGPGGDGRAWRARLAGGLMALVRLGAAWLVVAHPLAAPLARPPSPFAAIALPARIAVAAILGVGLAAFAWPRSCRWGLSLLLAGLAAMELLRRQLGLGPTPRLLSSVAILAVLAAGEWLTRRLEGRR
jgi:hypothetical protein